MQAAEAHVGTPPRVAHPLTMRSHLFVRRLHLCECASPPPYQPLCAPTHTLPQTTACLIRCPGSCCCACCCTTDTRPHLSPPDPLPCALPAPQAPPRSTHTSSPSHAGCTPPWRRLNIPTAPPCSGSLASTAGPTATRWGTALLEQPSPSTLPIATSKADIPTTHIMSDIIIEQPCCAEWGSVRFCVAKAGMLTAALGLMGLELRDWGLRVLFAFRKQLCLGGHASSPCTAHGDTQQAHAMLHGPPTSQKGPCKWGKFHVHASHPFHGPFLH